ncbi:hypothetical protein WOLCODRAFT_138177 [Wolfiporia cocos MD-104 SS10]|uniref:polynucleotide adenylyltransferase n=1 Tax=Wolfiporia cocos (strain MD-104) TaxID=742152 RepID=A0A2H3JVW8_WOLCO|nr:hypothetical protein WOLCODRAFT_138177 [Wolfiporia cocos MD-104 SS10]
MAAAFIQSALQSPRQHYLQPNTPPAQRKHASRQRFAADLSQCLYDLVIHLLPTLEELAVKEDVRKLLERLIRTIEPDSRLLSFGSTANGFSLRNSDMDLCCLIDSEERLSASDLVVMLGDLLERETKFHVKPLPHARIPIVKLTLDPAPGLPQGIACDIGFENRLALENTRLLMCYAMIDPARVRTMVLFLKVWSKRRNINSPYKGTLSSYGYVLLVIFFLVHVKNPPVLPNLQQMPPLRSISPEDTHLNGYNIWFFDDIDLLRQRWKSSNTETVAELLIDFFKYYSRDFNYTSGVASIRSGLLKKESKGWVSEHERGSPRERNRLCIEDPFETDYNVARCVTRDGLYTIRGEFMRASRILASRPDRALVAIAQLCEERKEEESQQPSLSRGTFVPPRMSPLPPQVPYTVGSSPMRMARLPVADRLSPSELSSPVFNPASPSVASASPSVSVTAEVPRRSPSSHSSAPVEPPLGQPEHMAPKRSKWTSPPPPEAPAEDHTAFADRLGQSLALATAPGEAREHEQHRAYAESSTASEAQTDDEARSVAESAELDDVRSVRSFTEEGAMNRRGERERDREGDREPTVTLEQQQQRQVRTEPMQFVVHDPSSSRSGALDARMLARLRGRPALRLAQQMGDAGLNSADVRQDAFELPPRLDSHSPRRSVSNPARMSLPARFAQMQVAIPNYIPSPQHLPQADFSPSPRHAAPAYVSNANASANVYYETTPPKDRLYGLSPSYSHSNFSPVSPFSPYQLSDASPYYEFSGTQSESPYSSPRQYSPSAVPSSSRQPAPRHLPPSLRRSSKLAEPASPSRLDGSRLSPSPASAAYSHSHTLSNATVTAATPRAPLQTFDTSPTLAPSLSRAHSPAQAQSRPHSRQQLPPRLSGDRSVRPASISSDSPSPPASCASSHYAASCSPLSTSPPSPTQGDTVGKQGWLLLPQQSAPRDHGRSTSQAPLHATAVVGADSDPRPAEGHPPNTSSEVASSGNAVADAAHDATAGS